MFTIYINQIAYHTDQTALTGTDLLHLAGLDSEWMIYTRVPYEIPVLGDSVITVKPGMKFYTKFLGDVQAFRDDDA